MINKETGVSPAGRSHDCITVSVVIMHSGSSTGEDQQHGAVEVSAVRRYAAFILVQRARTSHFMIIGVAAKKTSIGYSTGF